jgi:murein DD-endopeptidase MepM/ murein hydrolase activator NlpD
MRLACLAIGLLWTAFAGAEEPLYRVPWPEGLTFMIIQAPGGRITSHFTKATFNAVDIAMPEGIPIVAARSGVVEAVESAQGASPEEDPLTYEGNFVRVRHDDGTAAIYAHLKYGGVAVAAGDAVALGQLLGYSGATGDVLEPQLHFAVMREDASLPVTFYVGRPPLAFPPRAALRVTANYSGPAGWPRTPSEGNPPVAWKPHPLEPDEEAVAWGVLALWLACGLAALACFWRFSRN